MFNAPRTSNNHQLIWPHIPHQLTQLSPLLSDLHIYPYHNQGIPSRHLFYFIVIYQMSQMQLINSLLKTLNPELQHLSLRLFSDDVHLNTLDNSILLHIIQQFLQKVHCSICSNCNFLVSFCMNTLATSLFISFCFSQRFSY